MKGDWPDGSGHKLYLSLVLVSTTDSLQTEYIGRQITIKSQVTILSGLFEVRGYRAIPGFFTSCVRNF